MVRKSIVSNKGREMKGGGREEWKGRREQEKISDGMGRGGVARTGEETVKAGEGKGEVEGRVDLKGLGKGIWFPDTRQAPAWSSALYSVSTLESNNPTFNPNHPPHSLGCPTTDTCVSLGQVPTPPSSPSLIVLDSSSLCRKKIHHS